MRPPESSSRTEGRITIRVRYAECDPMGVAHHTAYPVWFEIGRTELLRARGMTYRDLEAEGVFLVVIDLSVRYKRPARYDDELTLITRIEQVSRVKIIHAYELLRGSELLATARTTLA
jgi:acyl-CoA thioester hydrolase